MKKETKKHEEKFEHDGAEGDEGTSETNAFGKEKSGIPESDWPKKFVVDGGLKYDFGGGIPEGGEDAPGKTHEYDKIGKLKEWPKKFVVDGRGGFDDDDEGE